PGSTPDTATTPAWARSGRICRSGTRAGGETAERHTGAVRFYDLTAPVRVGPLAASRGRASDPWESCPTARRAADASHPGRAPVVTRRAALRALGARSGVNPRCARADLTHVPRVNHSHEPKSCARSPRTLLRSQLEAAPHR